MAGISFSAADFVAKLRAGEFASAPLTTTGLVKLSEDDGDALLFAHANDCSNWVKIPVSLLESVEFLRTMPCKDHSHPLVTLLFRAPQSAEAQTFAAIAKLISAASLNPQASRAAHLLGTPVHAPVQPHAFIAALDLPDTVAPDANGNCPDGYTPCHRGLGCCRVSPL
jgi:hypothetical protein